MKAQHAQGAAQAQHKQGITGAQQLPHGLQGHQAEASPIEFVSISQQLYVQSVRHEFLEVQAEISLSAIDVLDEMLQSAVAQAMASGSCEDSSLWPSSS